MKNRHIGQVSFNSGAYESGLWEYATQEEHGEFSRYVKRLIERDRQEKRSNFIAIPSSLSLEEDEDIRAAGGFL